jgi:2-amino-4-hydroxy-6-hydroxymethyldihydropteridine diphosphokinase
VAREVAGQRTEVVIGLGANLGDRRATLAWAVRECDQLGNRGAVSSLYATDPVGEVEQPDFLNAALLLRTELAPNSLLEALLRLEQQAGRVRRERWGPRTLDLDILWIRGARVVQQGLEVPHPRLKSRVFALLPLVEVAPDAADPVSGTPYRAVLATLAAGGVRVAEPGPGWVPDDA